MSQDDSDAAVFGPVQPRRSFDNDFSDADEAPAAAQMPVSTLAKRKRRAPRRRAPSPSGSDEEGADESDVEEDEATDCKKEPSSKPKTPAARLRKEQLESIATKLMLCGNLVQCTACIASGSSSLWWFFDGELWHHPFAANTTPAITSALRRVLAREARDGRFKVPAGVTISKEHVAALLIAADSLVDTGAVTPTVMTAGTITAMRVRSRSLMPMRGGCLDLSGEAPTIVSPMPRDALVFADEVMDIDCPASLAQLLERGCEPLKRALRAVLGADHWVVFVDLLVRTLRGDPTKAISVLHSQLRSTFKSALVASILSTALGQTRCPCPGVDAYMVGAKWAAAADSTPNKQRLINLHGRSIIRHVDEASPQGRLLHFGAIKSEQTPYGKLSLSGAQAHVKAPCMPLYLTSTNAPPDAIFTSPLSREEAAAVFVFDTGANVFAMNDEALSAEDRALRDETRSWFLRIETDPTDAVRADVAVQLACLAAWWLGNPPERAQAAARAPQLTLNAHRARRTEEMKSRRSALEIPVGTSNLTAGDFLLDRLGAWLDASAEDFVSIDSCHGLRRSEIYERAGVYDELRSGGRTAAYAADVIDTWMQDHFNVGPVKLGGGYTGYRGVAFADEK